MRRRWPATLVSWSRLLAGGFRDPLVGRDVLFGCLLGSFSIAVRKTGMVCSPMARPPSATAICRVRSGSFSVPVRPLLIYRIA